MKIFLIPGHGGKDPGALGAGTVPEDELNLALGLQTQELLNAAGHECILSRAEDIYLSPSEQLALIREINPDCAVAMHFNSSANEHTSGVEAIWKDENDKPLASSIYQFLCAYTGMKQRGVKQDVRGLAVLKDFPVPSALIEYGFISDPEQYEYIARNIPLLAQCTFEGIMAWEAAR